MLLPSFRPAGHWLLSAVIVAATALTVAGHAQAETKIEKPDHKLFVEQICRRILAVAKAQNVPEAFLARLIWKESRFDPNAISPKGAQGIAQFMPATAQLVGLKDPFEPHQAIAASAQYLNSLKDRFGNWGLAAAGYNAGPGRVGQWLAGQAGMPYETRDFVASITGHGVDAWNEPGFKAPQFSLSKTEGFLEACQRLPVRNSLYASDGQAYAQPKPWGVQLAANFNRERALRTFQRLQNRYPGILKSLEPSVVRKINRGFGSRARFAVQIGADTRAEGNRLCDQLKRSGGACVVIKN